MTHVVEIARSVTDHPGTLVKLASQCYPDTTVGVEDAGCLWRITLRSVAPIALAYDRDLRGALGDLGISPREITRWHRIDRAGRAIWLDSLMSTWALVAWTHWLNSGASEKPCILHVGGRSILKVPLLVCEPDRRVFFGLMEAEEVRLDQPDTVAAAVERGLFGISSYLVPFLSSCPAEIVQVVDNVMERPVRFAVSGAPWSADPTVNLLSLTSDKDGACTYRQLSDPTQLTDCSRPVLLHIDLSYFDQISERQHGAGESSHSVSEFIEFIAPLAGQIECVTVARAPGICPARRWQALASELREALEPLL